MGCPAERMTMTTEITVPYSFTPGTKAKASEVNANFNFLAEQIANFSGSTSSKIDEEVDRIDDELSQKTNMYLDGNVRMSNGILEAPNGVASYATKTITAYQGLKISIPDGRNYDGTLKSKIVTLEEDVSLTLDNHTGKHYLFLDENLNLSVQLKYNVGYYKKTPNSSLYWYYYDEELNLWRKTITGSEYSNFNGIIIGELESDVGVISTLILHSPISLVKHSDITKYMKNRCPDYSAGVSYIPSLMADGYYAPSDGYLMIDLVPYNNVATNFNINGKLVARITRNNNDYTRLTGSYLLSEHDHFQTSANCEQGLSNVTFFPLKGVSIC